MGGQQVISTCFRGWRVKKTLQGEKELIKKHHQKVYKICITSQILAFHRDFIFLIIGV